MHPILAEAIGGWILAGTVLLAGIVASVLAILVLHSEKRPI